MDLSYQSRMESVTLDELVGHCELCGKQILCQNGFLNGIVREDKCLICFDCSDNDED